MSSKGYMLLVAGLAFSGVLFSQAQKDSQQKTPVDIKAEVAYRTPDLDDNGIIMTGEVVFHHNGAVISCDSAVRYSDRRIDCFKNVIINKDSIYVYGDRAEYNGNINLARVYSPIVKVIDGDATLYTYNFTFNTRDNIGTWFGGGVMYQEGNTMESEKGYYYSDLREIVAVREVEMKNDDYTVSSDSVRYNMDTKVAHFYSKAYIWTAEGDMITADRGRYDTRDSTYFFHGNAYVLTDFRETWADTIDFNAKRNDAILYGNIQIDDNDNASSAFGDYGQYWGERGETMLTKRPSLFNFDEEQNNSDTLYMRADTIYMYVVYPSDRPRPVMETEADRFANLRWVDSLPDSVRIAMADSLRTVISGLRDEANGLRRASDSIMNALYPAPAVDSGAIPLSVDTPVPLTDTAFSSVVETLPFAGSVDSPPVSLVDSLFGAVPNSLPSVDSLSQMDRIREQLPPELSGRDASALLEMLDRGVPETMSHLAVDSIDAAALRSVIAAEAEAALSRPEAEAALSQPEPLQSSPEPEAAETVVPENPEPPEVRAMRETLAAITARADSLQTAESYIRPQPTAESSQLSAQDSLNMVMTADSLALADSLAVVDSIRQFDPRAFKKLEKIAQRKLKEKRKVERAALKASQRAEKQRLREEKRAAKDAARAERIAARRKRAAWITETAEADSLAMSDSLRRTDSLMKIDSTAMKHTLDSLESVRPEVEEPAAEPDTTERIWRGWYDVKIWRKDMQAVCDSVVGFSRDSTVHMYTEPVLWHGGSQIVCDSLTLYTIGENIDRAEFFGDPIMSSKLGSKQFNQVTGESMTSLFRDNEVYRHNIFGHAEAFYYIQEDNDPAPVAFIVMTSSDMSFLMEDQYVRYIIAREQVNWPVYPIEQIPATQPVELKGFEWYEDRQPTLADVFDRTIRPAERAFHEALPRPEFPIAARIDRRREYLIGNRMWADRVDPLPAHAVEYVRSLATATGSK